MAPAALVLISISVPLSCFALIFGLGYLKSRENMALIERGINPRMKDVRPKPFVNLKWGLLLLGSGLGFLIAYLVDTLVLSHHVVVTGFGINDHDSDNPAIYFAMIAIGGGLGLVFSYLIEKKHIVDNRTI